MTLLRETDAGIGSVFTQAEAGRIVTTLEVSREEIVQQLDALLLAHQPPSDPTVDTVNHLIDALNNDETIQTVTAAVAQFHLSERTLQRLFQEYVGVGLKWVLVRNRLRAAIKTMQSNDEISWAQLAYSVGYSSQSHFVHDFTTVTGISPARYQKYLATTTA